MKKKMEQDNKEVLVSRNAASGVTEANFEWKNKIKVSKVIYQRLLFFIISRKFSFTVACSWMSLAGLKRAFFWANWFIVKS